MPTFAALLDEMAPLADARAPVWDALWAHRPIGRVAVGVRPSAARVEEARRVVDGLDLPDPRDLPAGWTPQWREALLGDLAWWRASWGLPGDACPVLSVPRVLHGHSQGICDLFGAQVEAQADGTWFVHPLPPDPARLAALEPLPLPASRYWAAVAYLRYARAVTGGRLPFRGPIMTGPFDTANYLLGSTVLLEWVYTEPEALHALLERLTAVIRGMVAALREAAGGALHAHHLICTRGGHDFASECRAIVSRAIYEAFEAPYLRRLGEALGPYAIHACGSWERTLASARQDPHLRVMNGQVKENDLTELCARAAGQVAFSIHPSVNLAEPYLFDTRADFFTYLLERTPPTQPLETAIGEEEIPVWNAACAATGRRESAIATAGRA